MLSRLQPATAEGASPATPGAHRALRALAVVLTVGGVAALIAVFTDGRTLDGAPVWLKPFKFTVSFAIYSATLAWLLPRVSRFPRAARWTGNALAVALLAEMLAISFQAYRGTHSHFNTMTPIDEKVILVMTVGVMALYAGSLVLIVLMLRDTSLEPELRTAFRFGLFLAFAGMLEGFLMNRPTGPQREAAAEGLPTLLGAHTVGVPDGGPGLPVTTWSTVGGDLRIAHFLALHALQILPLVAFALLGLARSSGPLRRAGTRARLVRVAGIGYAGVCVLLTWQAFRGQSLVHPDGPTWAVLLALVLVTAAACSWILVRARKADVA